MVNPITAETLDLIIDGFKPYGQQSDVKALCWDLETCPAQVAVFDLKTDYIHHENILVDWSIFCAGYKWIGRRGVKVLSVTPDDPLNDREIVVQMHKVLADADILIHQNGDRFDLRKFNARAIFHGLPPLPKIPSVDTLKVARKHFAFTSNRLDYLGKYLGIGPKQETPRGLWIDCMKGSAKALRTMARYNRRDVVLLEAIYWKLLPFIRNHPNLGLWTSDSRVCPNCGGDDVVRDGEELTRVNRFPRFRCRSCGAWSRGGGRPETILR